MCNLGFMADLDTSGAPSPGRMTQDSRTAECGLSHIPYQVMMVMMMMLMLMMIPYQEASVPFPIRLARCGGCGRGKVPDIVLSM